MPNCNEWIQTHLRLTLTLVVFEYRIFVPFPTEKDSLTLTLVVFELVVQKTAQTVFYGLTLTLVVFECDWIIKGVNGEFYV